MEHRLRDLDGADVEGIAFDLRSYDIEPDTATFELVVVPLSELQGWICSLDSYLQDRDAAGHERASRFASEYRAGQQLPAIVVAKLDGRWQVFDGLHRLNGAAAAGRTTMPCWQLIANNND